MQPILLAFQLENYQIFRFLCFIYTHPTFWIKGSERQKLERTHKTILLFSISLLVGISILIGGILRYEWYWLLSLPILWALYPLLLCWIAWILYPFEVLTKHVIISQAKKKVKRYPQVLIIWITGSYGKTSVKEFLLQILKEKYTTIATPSNHNTPLGISKFIQNQLNKKTEIMIIEMGAYYQGDIEELCKITPPNIAILTGIAEQHLERFKNLNTIIKTKFEIYKGLNKDWIFITDGENKNIQQGLKDISHTKEIKNIENIPTKNLPNFEWIMFEFEGDTYQSPLLGHHNAKNLAFAISAAKHLKIPTDIIQKSIKNIQAVPHRMQLITNKKTWIFIIDDSFNGNIEGVKATIQLLKTTPFSGKKVYLTPGLVELGNRSLSIHTQIGEMLASAVDQVLLIQNKETKQIEKWLLKNWFDSNNIIYFDNALQAHANIATYLKKGDLIVFQNDLTDNYL